MCKWSTIKTSGLTHVLSVPCRVAGFSSGPVSTEATLKWTFLSWMLLSLQSMTRFSMDSVWWNVVTHWPKSQNCTSVQLCCCFVENKLWTIIFAVRDFSLSRKMTCKYYFYFRWSCEAVSKQQCKMLICLSNFRRLHIDKQSFQYIKGMI